MNCQDIQKFAFTYLDGEFADHERGEFEEHLRRCMACRTVVDRDALLRDMVARHLRPGPCGVRAAHGQALRAKVCAGLDRHDRQRLGRSVGVSVAAVAVVAIAVGYGVAGDRGALSQVGQGQLTAALPLQVARQVAAAAVEPVARPAVRRAEAGGTARPLQPVAAVVPAPIPQALPGTGPALAGTASLAGSAALAAMPVRFVATQAGAVQRVSAHLDLGAPRAVREGEVLSGQLQPGALTERSAFGAVRSEDSLRQMVQVHVANLMPEVTGTPARIQRYLAARLPQVGALPLAQGAGLQLLGARIAVAGGQPVVIYSYSAFGTPLTVVSRVVAAVDDMDVERRQPDARDPAGMLLDHRGGLHLLHVVAQARVLTLVGELSPQTMVQLLPATPIL